jgi:TonB family protein
MQRQAGNPKENRTVVVSGAVMKDLPPAPAISLQADRSKYSVKTNPVVAAPPPIPALSTNEVAQATKPKVTPKFEPYVPSGVKKRSRITILAFGLGLSMIVAGINLWQFRIILFPGGVSNHPAQPASLTAPVPEILLPLAIPVAVELSSDPPSVAATADADEQGIRIAPAPPNVMTSVPSRPVAKARARTMHTKPGKFSNVHVPPPQDTRPPDTAITHASIGQPISVPPNAIPAGANEPLGSEPAEGKNSSPALTPAVTLPQESVSAVGSVEIKSDPHPSVHMTPELQWRASWPGINPKIGRLISSVDPLYPKDALRQRIAGIVHLHVVVGRSGAVEKVEPKDGPAPLADAALRAVQQWHFEPTIVAGQPIEAEQNITIVFRLANPNTIVN